MGLTRTLGGIGLVLLALLSWVALASWSVNDPSLNNATQMAPGNLLGYAGASVADLFIQIFGLAAVALFVPPLAWGLKILAGAEPSKQWWLRILLWPISGFALAGAVATLPSPAGWPMPNGLGGIGGDFVFTMVKPVAILMGQVLAHILGGLGLLYAGYRMMIVACGIERQAIATALRFDLVRPRNWIASLLTGAAYAGSVLFSGIASGVRLLRRRSSETPEAARTKPVAPTIARSDGPAQLTEDPLDQRIEPTFGGSPSAPLVVDEEGLDEDGPELPEGGDYTITRTPGDDRKRVLIQQPVRPPAVISSYQLPPLKLLKAPPRRSRASGLSDEVLQEEARRLESVLEDFGVRGEIVNVRPGPVVTLYELEPAPGTKSSRVIGLADDIARSMSAISARVAVVPGRNAIGIELPNPERDMVALRELLAAESFEHSKARLALVLGKSIGGEPVITDLSRMPHLLIAGTTGSGKSVGINAMIVSLLYRMTPEECRFIMVDPKMLELSVYDGIPHLLAPVVTDPKKAVVALKWTVREMEERYKRMSKIGVRNIDGYNQRIREARDNDEVLTRVVQTGFDKATGQPIYEQEEMDYEPMPYIVVVVDEMADLMMVAGKEIEGAVQRLAQMARAAGIHLITATQRPSVDVITGTIKANFPTRISFQVTSKVDSRTILGEQGAEQLLGQGDMLYMRGGGRISRVHGAFLSDEELEKIVHFLKRQGVPDYLEAVTESALEDDGQEGAAAPDGEDGGGNELYDQAVAIVIRDKKVSTSYIQRRLSIGYNRAASIIERMEEEGVIGAANHAGKREILVGQDEVEAPY